MWPSGKAIIRAITSLTLVSVARAETNSALRFSSTTTPANERIQINLITHYKRIDASAKAWLQARPVLVACVATGILSAAIVEVVCLDIFYAACGEELDPLLLAYHGVLLLAIPGFWLGIDRLRRPAAMVLFSLCAGQGGFAQTVVEFWPIFHSQTVISENNLGLLSPSWEVDNRTVEDMTTNGVTLTRSVYFEDVTLFGLKYYAPKRIQTKLAYNWSGPVNGHEVVFERPKATVGTTNQIPASAMPPLDWRPVVGTEQVGNDYWRTTTRGSPMVLVGTNTSARPYLVRIPCTNGAGLGFLQTFRFEPGQSRTFTIDGPGFFRIYLEAADEQLLPW